MPTKKTKIFLLITKGNLGGAQKYVYDLATHLPQDLFDTKVILGEGGELEKKLRASRIKTEMIESLRRDVDLSRDWKIFWTLVFLFRREKPDIIHLNSSKIGLLGALAGRLVGIKKIVFTAHGWASNEARPGKQKVAIMFLHWLTVLCSHQTIAVSEKTKNDLDRWLFIGKKFVVIKNGLAPIELLSRSEARQELAHKIWKRGFDPEALNKITIIGTISELHKNKGVDYLFEALGGLKEKLDHVLIWIIGDGDEIDNLKHLAKKLGLKDRIFFLGKVPEANRFMRAFDVFTLTSRTEAFPYVILEAGQASLPVVASSVGGIPEVISDFNMGLLVRPGNVREIKLALSRLLDNPSERNKFGDNLSKKVNRDYTIEKMVSRTITLYSD